MSPKFCERIVVSVFITCLILLSHHVWACSIPVFRYALERWHTDAYEVIVFHRATLSSEDQAMVDRIQKASSDRDFRANVIIKTVNLATSPDKAMRKLWETQSASELPWMVVRYPRFSMSSEDVWSGRFTVDAVELLLDSPIRREIVRRILEGDSAVWILLESGIQQQDEAAVRLLEMQLKKMEETLDISDPKGNTVVDMPYTQANSDLRVKFSMAPLSRNDPSEQMFIRMLLHTELDLKMVSKPMAFPIFGRGRVLYALVGDGINKDNIEMACAFLVGWCSCEVKELNPGVDLLMPVNWDDMIGEQFVEYYEQTTPIIGNSDSAMTKDGNSSDLRRNLLLVVMFQLLSVAIVTGVVLWRKKRKA